MYYDVEFVNLDLREIIDLCLEDLKILLVAAVLKPLLFGSCTWVMRQITQLYSIYLSFAVPFFDTRVGFYAKVICGRREWVAAFF